MCGFSGFFSRTRNVNKNICRKMTDTLIHRGPDDGGVWVDQDAGIALGHRRLSIQDLSPLGHQPMESFSGRYVVAYNGEIYNFRVLQKELEKIGCLFKGHSDTEVLLAAVDTWGIETALTRFVGMFAFALWDKKERALVLARDRLGEKPLYYGWQGKTFLFGSELKALCAHPDWQGEIDRDSLALQMRHNYIPTPYSIYKGVYKLKPGTLLRIQLSSPVGEVPELKAYWQAREVAIDGVNQSLYLSDKDAISALDTLLHQTIREKMISDVPLGAFLSGGIDSSVVVAMMQAESSLPVKTFTIGFHEEGYNEAAHAKAVAKHLGTEHTELYVTPEQAMDVIPRLPVLYDEPFSDSSQIPTFLVSEMTKQHVTVALSGDGGDELFCGYNRYHWGQSIWSRLSLIPRPLRGVVASTICNISPSAWDGLFKFINPVLPSKLTYQTPGDKLHKLAEILKVKSPEALYHALVSHWKHPEQLVLGSREPLTELTNSSRWSSNIDSFIQRMQLLDTVSYLPDDILVKVDRAAMGVSLETRVPFLDHHVVEFAWQLPMSMKLRDGQGKWVLRQVLHKYIPRELIERPKMGFGVPIDIWLRGPLRDWAEALLDEKRLLEGGFFNVPPIRQKWKEHLSGKRNWQYYLWDVLMFQA